MNTNKKVSQLSKTVILLVPGYKGSILEDPLSKKKVWISFGDLFSASKSLSLQNYPRLLAKGPVKKICLGRWNLRTFYEPFFQNFEKKIDIATFSYDWRLSPLDHLGKFDAYLKKLKESYQDIIIVAHSWGGYWVSYYLRFGTQHPSVAQETWHGLDAITSVFFAGVPFKGTLTAVEEICFGKRLVLNSTLLHRCATQSFPIGYYLLPRWENTCFYDKNMWKQYDHHLLDIGRRMLETHVDLGKQFSDRIHSISTIEPKISKTVYRIFGSHTQTLFSISPRGYAKGDGIILTNSSELPDSFRKMDSKEVCLPSDSHVHLLNNTKVLRIIEGMVK